MTVRKPAFRDAGLLIILIAVLPAIWFEVAGWRVSESAPQKIYLDGTPHTDRNGVKRYEYESESSFFPIGLYHALSGIHHGRDYQLSDIADAGFNTVHFWERQRLADIVGPAEKAKLQIVFHNPTEAEAGQFAGHKNVLSWYLDEEPTLRYSDDRQTAARKAFAEKKRNLGRIDPGRSVHIVDGPPGNRENWDAWAVVGDVVSFSVYPVRDQRPLRLGGPRSIAETTSRAVRLNDQRKPVWLVAQAFASPSLGWKMPTPRAYRAMVYTAIVHGATGVIAFAYDSFVTRDGQVLGIAPGPLVDYGRVPDYDGRDDTPFVATAAAIRQSRDLWQGVARVNNELTELTPALLSATAALPYRVSLRGLSEIEAPVRTLLKEDGDGFVLIAVNMDSRTFDVRFSFDGTIERLHRPFMPAAAITVDRGRWQTRFEPYETRIYRFELTAKKTARGEPET